jgi:dienelactone hydrolase
MRLSAAIVLSALAVLGLSAQSRQAVSLDVAMRAFWSADNGDRVDAAIKQVIGSGATFDEVAARLKAGREYGKQPTGRVDVPSRDHGISLDNVLEVPADYNPSRAWPLRVSLHGGVGREAPGPGDAPGRPLSNRIPGAGELVLHPRAWAQSEWWTAGQVENIARLIDRVKRQYNVDESRTYVTGISDGGTGVYFFAMRAATTWAACMPLNGHPLVLANPDVGADGQLYAGNMVNCPLHAVNGGRDPLYPADSVEPFIEMFRRGGVPVSFQVYPNAGHDTSWWPQERPQYEAFLAAHPRAAHPERISWETERVDRYNRFRWVVIDQLGVRSSDVALPDVNRYARSPGRDAALYDRSKPSGRVDAVRHGNEFELQTRGVRELTLLLSADVIDFTKPVTVTVNGHPVSVGASDDGGRLQAARAMKTTATLLKWAARDNDRTMLYGAELRIAVP